MKRLNFLVSLTNNDNDYQLEQAAAAEKAARRLGVDVTIIHASNDALAQSQQLLHYVQDSSVVKPDAIMFEPAGGTAFPQVARAAAAAGIGWVVLNFDVDYVLELRRQYKIPVFVVTADHEEIGKIQGQQFAALLPNGGSILYIEGPNNSLAAKQRSTGMNRTKPANIQVKSMRANWTEESAYKTVSSWLRLQTSQQSKIDLVGAQDDSMGIDPPTVTGAARHLIQAKAIFPLENPGILSILLGFIGAILGTLLSHEPSSQEKFNELLVRSNTGLGAEKATAQ